MNQHKRERTDQMKQVLVREVAHTVFRKPEKEINYIQFSLHYSLKYSLVSSELDGQHSLVSLEEI
jgi:hypothetical protein